MESTANMMSTSPARPLIDGTALADCIDACVECEVTCVSCADACLAEEHVAALRVCIRLNQDCADVCGATARIAARLFEAKAQVLRTQIEVCTLVCAACEKECRGHAKMMEHCRVCADACKRCEDACRKALAALQGS